MDRRNAINKYFRYTTPNMRREIVSCSADIPSCVETHSSKIGIARGEVERFSGGLDPLWCPLSPSDYVPESLR